MTPRLLGGHHINYPIAIGCISFQYVPPKPKLKGSPGDAPDSPIGMGGGYGGGSRGGPPAPTRGGPPAPARGGYSQAPAPAPGRSGPSGGRMGNTGPAPSKSGECICSKCGEI